MAPVPRNRFPRPSSSRPATSHRGWRRGLRATVVLNVKGGVEGPLVSGYGLRDRSGWCEARCTRVRSETSTNPNEDERVSPVSPGTGIHNLLTM
jgi:hypothetical protein